MTDETQAPSQGTETPTPVPVQPPVQEATPPQSEAQPSDPNSEQPEAVQRVVPAADGYQFEEGTPTLLGEIFNKLDMTQDQANGVLMLSSVREKADKEAMVAAGKKHIAAWGDVAETNINLAKRGRDYFDPTGDLTTLLNDTGFGNDPRLIEMFFQFGKRMEEGGFLTSEVNTPDNIPKDVAHLWYPDDAPGGKNSGYKS